MRGRVARFAVARSAQLSRSRGQNGLRWAQLLGSCVALLVLAAGCTNDPAPATPFGLTVFDPADRNAAPSFTAELLDGTGTYDVAEHAGDVLVINFWASWCAPCVAEAAELEQTYQATKADRVSFLGVNTRADDRDAARRFVAKHKPTYPNVFDPTGKIAMRFGGAATGMPATIVLDRNGRVAAVGFGAVARHALEPVVTQLAAESG